MSQKTAPLPPTYSLRTLVFLAFAASIIVSFFLWTQVGWPTWKLVALRLTLVASILGVLCLWWRLSHVWGVFATFAQDQAKTEASLRSLLADERRTVREQVLQLSRWRRFGDENLCVRVFNKLKDLAVDVYLARRELAHTRSMLAENGLPAQDVERYTIRLRLGRERLLMRHLALYDYWIAARSTRLTDTSFEWFIRRLLPKEETPSNQPVVVRAADVRNIINIVGDPHQFKRRRPAPSTPTPTTGILSSIQELDQG